MNTSTKGDIVGYLEKNGPSMVKQLVAHFGFNATVIHRHLKSLLEKGLITKSGTAPKVFYRVAKEESKTVSGGVDLSYSQIERLDKNYLSFDSDGSELLGHLGFYRRCESRGLNIVSQYNKYHEIVSQIEKQRNEIGLLSTLAILQKKPFPTYLDKLYVAGSYTVGQFGKSSLGSLAFYAKQSQSKELSMMVVNSIKVKVELLIKKFGIDAVCYAPFSIKREIQLMNILEEKLGIKLPIIKLTKRFPGPVIVPQKSIKGDVDRNKNATNTIFIDSSQTIYKKVLLIDDFIGSGATLNICAKKLKDLGVREVIGFAIVGNLDMTYEVINEV